MRTSSNELTKDTFGSADASSSSVSSLLAPERADLDFRIQRRLEASRQGMLQLEALRSKHQKLMKVKIAFNFFQMNYQSYHNLKLIF